MKINEVEALVGITRKNIRFYEAEGLLSPRRNSQNGYRDYGNAEVEALQMQQGVHTVGDGMRRHLITLERERKNIESSLRLCAGLTDRQEPLEELDAQALLDEMAQLEREGTTFMNKQKHDTKRRRYVAPVLAAILMAVLMAGLIWLFLWAFAVDPAGAPPLPVLALFVVIPAAVVVGTDPADSGDSAGGGRRCETILRRPGSGGRPSSPPSSAGRSCWRWPPACCGCGRSQACRAGSPACF